MIAAAVAGTVVVFGLLVLIRVIFRAKPAVVKIPELTEVDVASLSSAPPATDRIRLEIYNLPVRISAIVIASAGRNGTLPEEVFDLLDDLCPGLGEVCKHDRPSIVRWPPQPSTQGFSRAFFMRSRLPGDNGKGTAWCSVAGRMESGDTSALVGLILHSATPNSLGRITIERITQWLDVLRVRHDLS